MARQGLSSDKAEEPFDGSSGINLMVSIKVLGDKHPECSVGSYPVSLDQTHWPITWAVQILCTGEALRWEAHALSSGTG